MVEWKTASRRGRLEQRSGIETVMSAAVVDVIVVVFPQVPENDPQKR